MKTKVILFFSGKKKKKSTRKNSMNHTKGCILKQNTEQKDIFWLKLYDRSIAFVIQKYISKTKQNKTTLNAVFHFENYFFFFCFLAQNFIWMKFLGWNGWFWSKGYFLICSILWEILDQFCWNPWNGYPARQLYSPDHARHTGLCLCYCKFI